MMCTCPVDVNTKAQQIPGNLKNDDEEWGLRRIKIINNHP